MLPVNWFTRVIRTNPTNLAAAGQVETEHVSGKILWILNLVPDDKKVAHEILNSLSIEAGLRKLHYITATISKNSRMFETFIKCGYQPLGWETIWRFKHKQSNFVFNNFLWRKAIPSDLIQINLLQNKVLSLDEKRVLPLANLNNPKYVLFNANVLSGYACVQTSGSISVITPVLDPQIPEAANVINSFCRKFLNQFLIHYFVLTASQQWIAPLLQGQIELVHHRQEVLVKRIAIQSRINASVYNQISNGQHTDIATPLSQSYKQDNNI
jgi:hypothetical protein